jgi:hypothetical protein
MTDIDLLRTEVAHMSDRDILLEILAGQRTQNGAIAKHHDDLYGAESRNLKGVRPLVDAHELFIDRLRTRLQTLMGLIVVIGVGNLVALLTLAR